MPSTHQYKTVTEYLADLPPDRRKALQAVRKVIKANLSPGFKEGIQYNMIGYFVPHSKYPKGYHCDPKQPLPFINLASQKNHMAIYLFCLYGSEKHSNRFEKTWAKSGKKLDMGKSCVRFKKIEDVALDAVAEAVESMPMDSYIKAYEKSLDRTPTPRAEIQRKTAAKKAAAKKKTSKKTASKKAGKKTAKKTSKKTAKKTARR